MTTRVARCRARRRLTVAAACVALAWAGLSFAQDPQVRCTASVAGGRVVVEVDLLGFLDPELLKLIRLGLEGRLSLDVAVVKRRRFWFDAPVDTQSHLATFSYARSTGRLLVDGRRTVDNPAVVSLERVALRVGRDPDETYGVEVTARLQVITASSLDNLAGWISGRPRQEPILPQQLLQVVADELARAAAGRCEAKRPSPERVEVR
jgi:hypothetical protein